MATMKILKYIFLHFILVFVPLFIVSVSSLASENLINTLGIGGFLELAAGYKYKNDNTRKDDYNMMEARLQIKSRYHPSGLLETYNSEINFKGEMLVDGYLEKTDIYIRESNILITPLTFMDIKLGRQIFTWGTGDYTFINDLFPKDYISFLTGRDDEYLKKPSDGIRISIFNKLFNTDILAIPFFTPNTIPDGERLSFFDSFQGEITGINNNIKIKEKSSTPDNYEYALRAYRTFGSYELALYGFYGFSKMPQGINDVPTQELFYPELSVYGASIRGPFLKGISNFEFGYYDSREDTSGENMLIENSSFKILCGYAKDLGNDLNIGLQYKLNEMLDYSHYKGSLLQTNIITEQYTHLITLRITKLLLDQKLNLSLFTFYSPPDNYIYLRPSLKYKILDNLQLAVGANIINGNTTYSEFGQFSKNSNIYGRLVFRF